MPPPIVMIPGGPGVTRMVYMKFVKKHPWADGRQYILCDPSGVGLSARAQHKGPYTIEGAARDIEEIRQCIGGECVGLSCGKIAICSWSAGGLIATAYSILYPENVEACIYIAAKYGVPECDKAKGPNRNKRMTDAEIALYDAATVSGDQAAIWNTGWKRDFVKKPRDTFIQMMSLKPGDPNAGWAPIEGYFDQMVQSGKDMVKHGVIGHDGQRVNVRAAVHAMTIPILAIESIDDTAWKPDTKHNVANELFRGRLIFQKVQDAGHYIFVDKPLQCLQAMCSLLSCERVFKLIDKGTWLPLDADVTPAMPEWDSNSSVHTIEDCVFEDWFKYGCTFCVPIWKDHLRLYYYSAIYNATIGTPICTDIINEIVEWLM